MSARRSLSLVGLALTTALLLGASGAADVDALVRAGDDAFRRGDYGRAAELFERAGERATDPALVAFNLAATKYQLALADEGNVAALREAERLYACCLRRDDPRRPRALYGLGNCLLARGGAALDAGALRAAADAYARCLAEPDLPPELGADARHNLQRARLLLAQTPPPGREDDTPPGDDPDQKKDETGDKSTGPEKSDLGTGDNPDSRTGQPVKPEAGDKATPVEAPPSAGKGALPPVPDRAEPTPLTAEDAAEHLRQAARRIQKERQAHRKGRSKSAATGVPDW